LVQAHNLLPNQTFLLINYPVKRRQQQEQHQQLEYLLQRQQQEQHLPHQHQHLQLEHLQQAGLHLILHYSKV
jgi:hypothetical protein